MNPPLKRAPVLRSPASRRRGPLMSWVIAGAVALSGAVVEAQDGPEPGTAKPPPPPVAPAVTSAISPPKAPVQYEYSNVTLMISGIVLLGIGNVNIVTGLVLYQRDEARHVTPADGLITMGLGIAAALLSPALIAPGAMRVPVSPSKAKASSVTIEPTLTGLRFTF